MSLSEFQSQFIHVIRKDVNSIEKSDILSYYKTLFDIYYISDKSEQNNIIRYLNETIEKLKRREYRYINFVINLFNADDEMCANKDHKSKTLLPVKSAVSDILSKGKEIALTAKYDCKIKELEKEIDTITKSYKDISQSYDELLLKYKKKLNHVNISEWRQVFVKIVCMNFITISIQAFEIDDFTNAKYLPNGSYYLFRDKLYMVKRFILNTRPIFKFLPVLNYQYTNKSTLATSNTITLNENTISGNGDIILNLNRNDNFENFIIMSSIALHQIYLGDALFVMGLPRTYNTINDEWRERLDSVDLEFDLDGSIKNKETGKKYGSFGIIIPEHIYTDSSYKKYKLSYKPKKIDSICRTLLQKSKKFTEPSTSPSFSNTSQVSIKRDNSDDEYDDAFTFDTTKKNKPNTVNDNLVIYDDQHSDETLEEGEIRDD